MELNGLEALLRQACGNVAEGEAELKDINRYPAILYWPILLEPVYASGSPNHYGATYQISYFDKLPPRRSPGFRRLADLLRESRASASAWHIEYIQADRIWHCAATVDVDAGETDFFVIDDGAEGEQQCQG